jgi:hypothetical protein
MMIDTTSIDFICPSELGIRVIIIPVLWDSSSTVVVDHLYFYFKYRMNVNIPSTSRYLFFLIIISNIINKQIVILFHSQRY